MRLNVARGEGAFDSFRLPVLRPAGQHGIYNAQAFREFDADAYMVNFTVRFLGSRGTQVDHVEGCDCVASRLPNITIAGVRQTPAHFLQRAAPACTEADLKICDQECAAAWGILTPEMSACTAD